jgi:hypothetical protein
VKERGQVVAGTRRGGRSPGVSKIEKREKKEDTDVEISGEKRERRERQ